MTAILALSLLASAPAVAAEAPRPAAPANEIVVRGKSLQALRDDLDRCIAARCPVRQDVIASVRVAEALFRTGRYQDSRALLQRAIDRDRAGAAADPLAVAALYEATTTVALHDGEQDVAEGATDARARLLAASLGPDSFDALRAGLDALDLGARHRLYAASDAVYRRLADRATAAHQPLIAALATFRRAEIARESGEPGKATALLDAVATSAEPLPAGVRLAALQLKVRAATPGERPAAVAAFRAALAHAPQASTTLLFAPPPPRPADERDLNYFNIVDRETKSGDDQRAEWADISFAIRPDGTVEAPEALRGTLNKGDLAAIEKAIGLRRYTAAPAQEGNRYRVERWTLTADYGVPIGSLIRQRIFNPHFASLDITTDQDVAARGGAG